jgi:WD40 repeat protein
VCTLLSLGHTDAVWGLSYHGPRGQLLSCSADGFVKLWSPSPTAHTPLLKTFGSEQPGLLPTSVDWVYDEPTHLVAGYSSGAAIIYDIDTGKQVIKLDTEQQSVSLLCYDISGPAIYVCRNADYGLPWPYWDIAH